MRLVIARAGSRVSVAVVSEAEVMAGITTLSGFRPLLWVM